jgi:hypothetical protein
MTMTATYFIKVFACAISRPARGQGEDRRLTNSKEKIATEELKDNNALRR